MPNLVTTLPQVDYDNLMLYLWGRMEPARWLGLIVRRRILSLAPVPVRPGAPRRSHAPNVRILGWCSNELKQRMRMRASREGCRSEAEWLRRVALEAIARGGPLPEDGMRLARPAASPVPPSPPALPLEASPPAPVSVAPPQPGERVPFWRRDLAARRQRDARRREPRGRRVYIPWPAWERFEAAARAAGVVDVDALAIGAVVGAVMEAGNGEAADVGGPGGDPAEARAVPVGPGEGGGRAGDPAGAGGPRPLGAAQAPPV